MNRKVLLVDDDRLILEMLRIGLERMHMETKTAINGVQALQIAWDFQPDVIVMDIMMPVVDGMEAASILKNHPRTSKIPIIFISGKGSPPESSADLAEAFIPKPFQLEELVQRMNSVLQERESLDREVKEERDFFGKLSLMGLPDLIQFFEKGGNTGKLTLTSEGIKGVIYLQDGKILEAAVGQRRGKWAVFHMLSWVKGDFSFRAEPVSVAPAIYATGAELVLEGIRRLDERGNLLTQLPDLGSVPTVKAEVKEKLDTLKAPPELRSFVQMFDGKRTLWQIIQQGGDDELVTLQRIVKLYSSGLLEESPPPSS